MKDNQKVLEKAIQKAIDGGWYSFADDLFGKITMDDIILRHNPGGQGWEWTVKGHENNYSLIKALIYSHDFAKALWGDKKITRHRYVPDYHHLGEYILEPETSTRKTNAWKHHLQQMVIADDPIEYLGKNI